MSEKITIKERVLWLEEVVTMLFEYNQGINEAYEEVLFAFSKFIDNDVKNKGELNKWVDSIEKRFTKITTQQNNLAFVFNTLYPVTPEQLKLLEEKKNEIKNKVIQKKEE